MSGPLFRTLAARCVALAVVAFGTFAGTTAFAVPMLDFAVNGFATNFTITSTGTANTDFGTLVVVPGPTFSLAAGDTHTFDGFSLTAAPSAGTSPGDPNSCGGLLNLGGFFGGVAGGQPCTWSGDIHVDLGFTSPAFGTGAVSADGAIALTVGTCFSGTAPPCPEVSGQLTWTTAQPQTFFTAGGSSFTAAFQDVALTQDSVCIFTSALATSCVPSPGGSASASVPLTITALDVVAPISSISAFPGPGAGAGQASGIPEPASLALFGAGLLGLGFLRRRRRSAARA